MRVKGEQKSERSIRRNPFLPLRLEGLWGSRTAHFGGCLTEVEAMEEMKPFQRCLLEKIEEWTHKKKKKKKKKANDRWENLCPFTATTYIVLVLLARAIKQEFKKHPNCKGKSNIQVQYNPYQNFNGLFWRKRQADPQIHIKSQR